MKDLEWYALIHNFDSNKVEPYNVIFDRLIKVVKKLVTKNATYNEIKFNVKCELMRKYWSRTEYEFVCSEWSGKCFEQKIDIWYQLEPNLDRITEYLIINLAPRKYKKIFKTKEE